MKSNTVKCGGSEIMTSCVVPDAGARDGANVHVKEHVIEYLNLIM